MGHGPVHEETSFFEEKLGYFFSDRRIIEEALTHASYAKELGLSSFNERLEYLGDAVLELCVSQILYAAYPDASEGELTKARASTVCESTLAKWALSVDLSPLLRISKGLERQNGRKNPSVLADALEAVFGAIFLDGGYGAAFSAVRRFFDAAGPASDEERKDAKSLLQERLQAMGDKPPLYRLVGRSGPDHATFFKVEAGLSNGTVLAVGKGTSIKSAEFDAAEKALHKLSKKVDETA